LGYRKDFWPIKLCYNNPQKFSSGKVTGGGPKGEPDYPVSPGKMAFEQKY